MLYILTMLCIVIGIGYHCMQKIRLLRIQFPVFTPHKIIVTFLSVEWDTLITSFIGLIAFQLAIYVIILNEVKLPDYVMDWLIYILAVIWGYASQRLAYKYLGTAEKILEKKADDIQDKYGVNPPEKVIDDANKTV